MSIEQETRDTISALEAKLAELDKKIKKDHAAALAASWPFRKAIIDAKGEQKRLRRRVREEKRFLKQITKPELVQCAHIRDDGGRCQFETAKEYCGIHDPSKPLCSSPGCRHRPSKGEDVCSTHHPLYPEYVEYRRGLRKQYGANYFFYSLGFANWRKNRDEEEQKRIRMEDYKKEADRIAENFRKTVWVEVEKKEKLEFDWNETD